MNTAKRILASTLLLTSLTTPAFAQVIGVSPPNAQCNTGAVITGDGFAPYGTGYNGEPDECATATAAANQYFTSNLNQYKFTCELLGGTPGPVGNL